MIKRDALRLRVGDEIVYGPSKYVTECIGRVQEGKVLHVTSRGGIRVRLLAENREPTELLAWVPYHHVIYVRRRVAHASR